MSLFVYVSGPYSKGSVGANVHAAIKVADALLEAGFRPFVPHLSMLWDTVSPKPYETWLDLDFAWIERCDMLVRLPGESSGSDREVLRAKALAKPVVLLQAGEDAPTRVWREWCDLTPQSLKDVGVLHVRGLPRCEVCGDTPTKRDGNLWICDAEECQPC